jgi:acetyl esterase/lipase
MNNQVKYIRFLVAIFAIGINSEVKAQDEVIPLWTTTIPGEINTSEYQEKEIYKDGKLQSTSMVTLPTLSVYLPPKTIANGTAVLIFPGGGYSHLSMEKEGKKVANWLNSLGITAFVLKYRLPNDQIMEDKTVGPLQDAQEAMRMIRRNTQKWKVDTNKIGVIGFSAGGHLAATLCTHYDEIHHPLPNPISARPDFALLIYPVISMTNEITHKGSQNNLLGNSPTNLLMEKFSNELCVNSKTPLTFLVHATDDPTVAVENSVNYYLALKKYKVPVELHLYEKGGHGFGLGVRETSMYWTTDCINWLINHEYVNCDS